MDVDVETSAGTVRGDGSAGLFVFRGIPFADLPERFAAPGPPAGWRGVRSAAAFGPSPPQSSQPTGGEQEDSTDWLTVNVWTPDLTARAPVMVWIHGGGYVFGTSGLPEYDGSVLAGAGVVVVTLNYRVGFEGFGLVDGSPANRGLLDQVAALVWVRANIAAFGGDPEQITLFGQSAGAGSIAALLVMPAARGLFQRAIAQSVPGAFFTPALARDVARVCASEAGVDLARLADVPPRALVDACDRVAQRIVTYGTRWGRAAYGGVLFAPVVDGEVLPSTPWEGLRGDVPLVVGHTRHEQRLLSLLSGQLGAVSHESARQSATIFAPDPEAYLAEFPDAERLFEEVRSDWLFRMPSAHLALAQRRAGGTVYLAELLWAAPGMDGLLGACHGLDVPLAFGNLSQGSTATLIGEVTPAVEEMSDQLRAAWVGFATNGDPGWPPFDDRGTTHVFDLPSTNGSYPEAWSLSRWPVPPTALDLASE